MGLQQIPSKGGIPSGNTSARPGSPVIGDTYYNGQLEQLEIYNGTSWVPNSAPPLAPTIATPTDASAADAYSATGGKLSVVFTRNTNGGLPSQYNAYTTSGGFSASNSTSTVTITGLTPGTSYTVYGNAQNNFGVSTNTSNSSSVTPTTKPQAPTIGTATAGDTQATLTFTAGNNGGSSITNYKYSTNGTTYTAFSPAQTTSPLTITGLTNGNSYSFYLKAVNANGDSTASAQSNSITPFVAINVNYLVVAGGGGGGHGDTDNRQSSGGGAGGLRSSYGATGGGGSLESSLTLAKGSNYTVTIGAGGAIETDGTNSVFATITSLKGGAAGKGGGGFGGGGSGTYGSGGGQGGTGGGWDGPNNAAGTAGQGYQGGSATTSDGAGGGGGAGSAGGNAGGSTAGTGGNGINNSITGTSVGYAGGGGNNGDLGYGGGFNGSSSNRAAVANKGGGGKGNVSGTGGSGVVVVRWLTSDGTITVGAGLTADSTGTDGSYSYKRFTAGTGNVSWS